ncbi:LOW QUALITY PROTEIN: pre-mRNA-splicing factor CWC25 homolog [Tachyglossus aculeatus]|uniref:LOW QUALITY PROTEIN: pre-mRNA-splicing factor CWC25 homolog n=1 Tax=Tachyglossus aculeatus TaxID=9261 RepID=UPI0018F28366|nr:LOW QUALITY PROTEIN: pre-mRNA-splicing factor CWC25 homolog [Tachyglossus aculeatus]
MGGGDLNLKKSWHPQTLRNVEKVWKAEQKHEAERKKIEELQRELREERAREEMQRYAEDVGAVKKKEEKLDWMYQGPGGLVNRDEYLMGRPVDKYVLEKSEDKEASCSSETGLLPGSIFAPSGANSVLDMASKIREDPLFIIRKREEEKKREVLNNPVKMKKIKALLQLSLEKKEKKRKKEKKKKHKKHKHRSSSSEASASEGERSRRRMSRKPAGSPPAQSRVPGYGLLVRDPEQRGRRPEGSPTAERKSGAPRPRDRSRSVSRSPRKGTGEGESRSRQPRSPGPGKPRGSKGDRKDKERGKSPQPKKEGYTRRHASGYTRKLPAEELERKRQEMMDNAKWREEERLSSLRKHERDDEREQKLEKLDSRDGKFIQRLKLESTATSSLEDRLKRNIHSIQRTPAALEKNFMKR